VPLSPVLPMGGLNNRWAPLADVCGPVAAGIVGVGDTLVHTNPTLGQGTALALRTAQWVGRQALTDDPYDLACRHHAWALHELLPWLNAQITSDHTTESTLRDGISETITGGMPADQHAATGKPSATPKPRSSTPPQAISTPSATPPTAAGPSFNTAATTPLPRWPHAGRPVRPLSQLSTPAPPLRAPSTA
jgi:hypothetical protein